MASRGKCFTPEEVEILEVNPYTRRVLAGSVSITMEAKQRVLELYETGKNRYLQTGGDTCII